MAARGGQIGNQNPSKNKPWTAAIQRVLARRSKSRKGKIEEIEELAGKLLDLALAGDMPALKEVGDRLEGKPAQIIAGEGGGPIRFELVAPWMKDAITKRGLG